MRISEWRKTTKVTVVAAATVSLLLSTTAISGAAPDNRHNSLATLQATQNASGGGAENDLYARSQQYEAVRTAPAATVSSAAFAAAFAQAAALPAAGGSWSQITDQPYNSDSPLYRDPSSNGGGGYADVSGRMTAIAIDGTTIYGGGADGGVWKSTDAGKTWTPLFDQQTSLAIGAIAVNPADHSVWVGTGEENSSFDGYSGNGIYRSADGGQTWQLVGKPLNSSLVGRITFDSAGHVLVATSQGLLRRSTSDLTSAWNVVLKPDPNPTHSPYRGSWMSDVRVQPGTAGKVVIAALGWRGGTLSSDLAYNGFYQSNKGGAAGTWHKVTLTGALGGSTASQIGRTTFSYTPDGKTLYAVIESTATVALLGVYKSSSGNAAGPWTMIAGARKLDHSPNSDILTSAGESAGVQAWYNQYVLVDPAHPTHVYVGLEEIYESTDGGATWTTLSPYWDFGEPCWNADPSKDTCPVSAHTDQHAAAVAGGVFYAGNDGGMYSRPTSSTKYGDWTDLNANLHTLQYYYGSVGTWPSGGNAYWGGTQDNGQTLLKPNSANMVSPEGGDGADNLVNPANAKQALTSYVYLIALERTENGGQARFNQPASYTDISMTCASFGGKRTVSPCEPNPRFIAPFVSDVNNINHWVAGGQYVWDNQGKGWKTTCTAGGACDWVPVFDLGTGGQTTSLGVNGAVTYAGWCGNGCNPGGVGPFVSGIATNYGGAWHRLLAHGLPNRIPTSIQVDPANSAHVWVAYGAFSRRWIAGGGVGHVFESFNGGATWRDDSGNLPDAPVNRVLVTGGHLVVGTDVGVFVTSATSPGKWSRVGTNLPHASVNDLQVTPDGHNLVAYLHGRGIWQTGL